ncbi:MAG: proline racemase family protein [Halobacteriales archaeon]|nr:proline racemase family protein [Halobacteriales archaeon]
MPVDSVEPIPALTSPTLPGEWRRIETIDAHAGGEPLRVIVAGVDQPPGETMLARRRWLRTEADEIRTALMGEPRGHTDMYGALLTPPTSADGDLGVLFMHNEGYSTMCGHGIIALGTVLLETGMVDAPNVDSIVFDTPAGPVTATPTQDGDRVTSVTFRNVPSFVYARDRTVTVPEYGSVTYDLAFGGAYYAYCSIDQFDLELVPENADRLVDTGMAIKHAVADALTIDHPGPEDLGFLYGTIFTGPPRAGGDTRNVCIFADGQVDRSPTGTGVSGRVALAHDRREHDRPDALTVESIIDTTFTGRGVESTTVGEYPAVVPSINGSAHVTGHSTFVIDPDDPLASGFLLG